MGDRSDFWINARPARADAELPRTLANVAIHGLGGNDSITVDESAGAIQSGLALDSLGGSLALKIVGTTGDDTLNINGDQGQILFGSQTITANQLS